MPNAWTQANCRICGQFKAVRGKSMVCAPCGMKRNEVSFFPRACAHSEAAITETGISYVVQCPATLMPGPEDYCEIHASLHWIQIPLEVEVS